MTQVMTESDYMGIFVEEEVQDKSCTTCRFEHEVDRHECNYCARVWQESNMTKFVEWKSKQA